MENLERCRPVVLEVLGQEDRGHTAASQLAVDPVAVGQSLKAIQQIGQACSGRGCTTLHRHGARGQSY
jgi:hypothetical protein